MTLKMFKCSTETMLGPKSKIAVTSHFHMIHGVVDLNLPFITVPRYEDQLFSDSPSADIWMFTCVPQYQSSAYRAFSRLMRFWRSLMKIWKRVPLKGDPEEREAFLNNFFGWNAVIQPCLDSYINENIFQPLLKVLTSHCGGQETVFY